VVLLAITGLAMETARAALPVEVPGVLGLTRGPGGEVYVITGEPGGLYRAADGLAWVQLALDLPNTYFSAVAVAPDGTVYAAGSEGLFRSTDNGRTWTALSTEEQVFFLLPLADGTLLARTWRKGLLRSEDKGNRWYRVGAELYEGPVSALVQDRTGAVWAATFGGGIYRSKDGGATWEQVGLEQSYVTALAMDGEGTLYAGVYQGGTYRYGPAGWVVTSAGLPAGSTVQVLSATPTGLAAGVSHEGLYFAPQGGFWTAVASGPAGIEEVTGILSTEDGELLVATRPQGLFRVNPVTRRWTPLPLHAAVQAVAADGQGGAYALLSGRRLLHSVSKDRWEYVGQVPAGNGTLLITHSGVLLAGGTQGLSTYRDGVWQQVSLPSPDFPVTCLAETGKSLIAGGQGLLHSIDGGITWTTVMEKGTVQACAASSGRFYVATETGLAVSTDGGAHWTPYSLSPPPVALAADGERGVILARAGGSTGGLMEATEGAPVSLYLDESEGGVRTARALTVSGDTLYVAAAHGIDLFHRQGTFWHWQGQVLPRATATGLAPLSDGRAAVASDQGLFVLRGAEEAVQVPVIP
jgi:ligand-binding sensor domain-containing protein